MTEAQKTETESWWAYLTWQTEQKRAEECAPAAQDRADRMRARSQEQPAETIQRRRMVLRP
jgi:hypothetical protein